MRRRDDSAPTPEVAAALMAIDATLAGDPVDPDYAELAELALILRDERPVPADGFTAALDERVERRFARPARGPEPKQRARRGRRWLAIPGAVAGAAVAGVLVVLVVSGGGGREFNGPGPVQSSSSAAAMSAPAPRASAGASSPATGAPGGGAQGVAKPMSPATAPGPVNTGHRQIVQSAQLQLSAAPNRIDAVAQEVFDVIGSEKGIVDSSNVTSAGNSDGSAEFSLSVPSASLGQTLTALSELRGANVVSRSDATQDITGQVGGAGERLAEARALRRSLLKQLAAATTTAQVDSLAARIHDADASIASDLSTLRGLQRQVAYSKIAVTIQATGPAPVAGGGFTLGRAAHDAGRLLVVVAGGALIGLAVLVPVALVAALVGWAGLAVRRRRREQALDLL